MPEKPSDTIESIAPSLPTPIRGRARRTVLDDPANRPAILIDGPVPQVRMRSGRKLRRAQQVSHWTRLRARHAVDGNLEPSAWCFRNHRGADQRNQMHNA
jgi:hypothetical protein